MTESKDLTENSVKNSKKENSALIENATKKLIREKWGAVSGAIKENAGPLSISALKNDEYTAMVARIVYSFLPRIVIAFVSEDYFTSFLIKNKNILVSALEERNAIDPQDSTGDVSQDPYAIQIKYQHACEDKPATSFWGSPGLNVTCIGYGGHFEPLDEA